MRTTLLLPCAVLSVLTLGCAEQSSSGAPSSVDRPSPEGSSSTEAATASTCPLSPTPLAAGPYTDDAAFAGAHFSGDPTSIATLVTSTTEYKVISGRSRRPGEDTYGPAIVEVTAMALDPCRQEQADGSPTAARVTGYLVPGNPFSCWITTRGSTDVAVASSDGSHHTLDVSTGRWSS